MNVTEQKAKTMICPIVSTPDKLIKCTGSICMMWQFDEEMFDGPDSYVSDPGPLGHCGLTSKPL